MRARESKPIVSKYTEAVDKRAAVLLCCCAAGLTSAPTLECKIYFPASFRQLSSPWCSWPESQELPLPLPPADPPPMCQASHPVCTRRAASRNLPDISSVPRIRLDSFNCRSMARGSALLAQGPASLWQTRDSPLCSASNSASSASCSALSSSTSHSAPPCSSPSPACPPS